jgi:hypothetical protein
MRKHDKQKLRLDALTVRSLSDAALADAAGAMSGNHDCNYSDLSCKCNRTQGATCYTAGAKMCNSGDGMGTCTG